MTYEGSESYTRIEAATEHEDTAPDSNEAEEQRASELEEVGTVDRGMLEAYTTYDPHGPRVGDAEVIDRETGETVRLDVRVNKYDAATLEYNVCTTEGRTMGYTWVRTYTDEAIQKLPEHHPLSYYGNDRTDQGAKVYVDQMKSYDTNTLKGVGTALHEIAVERAFQLGADGRVQLLVAGMDNGLTGELYGGRSAGFHESFGFEGQDVYNEDGSLHHPGQRIHEQLAESRYQQAQLHQKIHGVPPQDTVHDTIETYSKSRTYMALSAEAIQREKERMQRHPHLIANKETTDALLQKHEVLAFQAGKREKAEAEIALWEKNQKVPSANECRHIAELFTQGNDPARASEYFIKAAQGFVHEATTSGHFVDYAAAAEAYAQAGDTDAARALYAKAGALAVATPGLNANIYAAEYFAKAGMEQEARAIESTDPTYRDY